MVDYLIMNKIYFEQPTEIRTATILEEVFGCSEIYFEKDAVIVFMGTAKLSNGVHFRGMCEIGDKVSIDTGCVLDNVSIGGGTNIRSHSILKDCRFGKKNIIGPHCFVRDDTCVPAGQAEQESASTNVPVPSGDDMYLLAGQQPYLAVLVPSFEDVFQEPFRLSHLVPHNVRLNPLL